jgi:hypothetical protein
MTEFSSPTGAETQLATLLHSLPVTLGPRWVCHHTYAGNPFDPDYLSGTVPAQRPLPATRSPPDADGLSRSLTAPRMLSS